MAAEVTFLEGSYLVPMKESFLPTVQKIEAASYPADEAASPAALKFRMQNAASFFYVALSSHDDIIGYICSTTTTKHALGS
jgi:hypothetical protein